MTIRITDTVLDGAGDSFILGGAPMQQMFSVIVRSEHALGGTTLHESYVVLARDAADAREQLRNTAVDPERVVHIEPVVVPVVFTGLVKYPQRA